MFLPSPVVQCLAHRTLPPLTKRDLYLPISVHPNKCTPRTLLLPRTALLPSNMHTTHNICSTLRSCTRMDTHHKVTYWMDHHNL